MPDGSKGFDTDHPFNTHQFPSGAMLYDPKFRWYLKVHAERWYWWCWLTTEWVSIEIKYELPTYDRSFRLYKNPSVSWETLRYNTSPKQYNRLREKVMERRKLPFIRKSKTCIATITHCLSWPQRLYLCWFRGFKRDPDAPGFSFIKNRKDTQG